MPPKKIKPKFVPNVTIHLPKAFDNIPPITPIQYGYFAMTFILFIILCVSVATPYWLVFKELHHQGMWKVCAQVDEPGVLECNPYQVLPGYLTNMQVLSILTILLQVANFTFYGFLVYRQLWTIYAPLVLNILSGLMFLVAMSIFTDKNVRAVLYSNLEFGYSYFLGWVSVILMLSGIGVGVYIVRKESYQAVES